MMISSKIARISVTGLHGVYDYKIAIPPTEDVVILIAPNGYGKTALLSLVNDCLNLKLSKAANRVFSTLTIEFQDGTSWKFERKVGELSSPNKRDYELNVRMRMQMGARSRTNPYWVDFIRLNKRGKPIAEKFPDMSPEEQRSLFRIIERTEPWLLHIASDDYHSSRARPQRTNEVLGRFFASVHEDDSIRQLVGNTNPSFVWPSLQRPETLFIETQRILYEDQSGDEKGPNSTHREEINRQAKRIAAILQKTYGEYASTSQSLDRTFPNRLIERAQRKEAVDSSRLRSELVEIERKRKELTDVGVLVEQSETLPSTGDDLIPEVLSALQIYVEDSKKKLSIFDDIFPRLEIFTEVIDKKLAPKKLAISREDGAKILRGDTILSPQSLSSGEKHEFIMLFKLAFETQKTRLFS